MKKRKSFTLFITLMFLISTLFFISKVLDKNKELIKEKEISIFQYNILLMDIIETLKTLKKDEIRNFISNEENVISIPTPDENIEIKFFFKNKLEMLNPNLLNRTFFTYKFNSIEGNIFYKILEKSNIQNKNVLIDIFSNYQDYYGVNNIKEKDFEFIKNLYYVKTDDKNIFNKEFNDNFSFGNNKINLKYISNEFKKIILETTNSKTINEISQNPEYKESIVNINNNTIINIRIEIINNNKIDKKFILMYNYETKEIIERINIV